MASVNHYGEDIDTINNVTDYIECNQLCNERDECFIWTYVEGECYAKTQNTFKVRSADVIGGYKDCKSGNRESKLQIQLCVITFGIKYYIYYPNLVMISEIISRLHFRWNRQFRG